MKRRTLLAGAGGSLLAVFSGCLGADTGTPGDDSEDAGTDEKNESSVVALSLATVDDDPEPLSFEIDLFSNQLTGTEVPVLDIAVENTGDETATWSYGGGVGNLPFPQGIHDSNTRGLVIGLEDEIQAQIMDASGGCARLKQFTGADGIEDVRLEPSGTLEERYAVAGVNNNLEGNCPKPNTYRIEYDFAEYGTWGFEAELS